MNTFSYKGNLHPFAAVLLNSADSNMALPVLEKLFQTGQRLYLMNEKNFSEAVLNKACCVIVLLSGNYYESEAMLNAYMKAGKLKKGIISIRIDDAPMPEVLANYSYSKNSLNKSKLDDDALVQKILSAKELQNPRLTSVQVGFFKKIMAGLLFAVLFVAAAIGIGMFRTGKDKNKAITETATATEPGIIEPEIPESGTTEPEIPESGTTEPKISETEVTEPGITEEELAKIVAESGITKADLEKVQTYVLAGDYVTYSRWNEKAENFVSSYWNDELKREEYVLVKSGENVEMGGPEDLSFLTKLPNLKTLILINQNADTLPDLSSLENLTNIMISGSAIKDIKGLKNCPQLASVFIQSDIISDLNPLNNCPALSELRLRDCSKLKYLYGLKLPNLTSFEISSATLENISAVADWKSLSSLKIETRPGCPVFDVSPIGGCSNLNEVYLDTKNSHMGIDPSFLSTLTKLESLDMLPEYINGGLDGIENCSSLKHLSIAIGQGPQWLDLNCLGSVTSLDSISLENINGSMDFLTTRAETMPELQELILQGNELELSGIGSMKLIRRLEIQTNGGYDSSIFAQFKNTRIHALHLANFGHVDLSDLPENLTELGLFQSDFEDLGQLPCKRLTKLYFGYNYNIRSLSGIEELTALEELQISDCYRLTDFDALYSLKKIRRLGLERQFVLPDYSKIQFSMEHGIEIALIGIPEMQDLSCLDALPAKMAGSQKCYIHVTGKELENLNALYRFKGIRLTVSDHLAVQAQDLVNKGCFREFQTDNTNDQEEFNPDISWVHTIEDLQTMPRALLKYIRYLCIAGDNIFDDHWWVNPEMGEGGVEVYAYDHENNGKETITQASQPLDMELISQITGLESLILVKQQIASIDPLQNLEKLRYLQIIYCDIEDVSPIFAIDTLEELSLAGDNITSIDGIQNLRNLKSLSLMYSEVADISPLAKMQFSAEAAEEGFTLELPQPWIAKNYPRDVSAIAVVPKYRKLDMNSYRRNLGIDDWVPYLTGKEIVTIILFNSFESNEQLERFAESVGSVEELDILYNDALTDLTCLTKLNGLQRVFVSQNEMAAAIASLENVEIPFELIIE